MLCNILKHSVMNQNVSLHSVIFQLWFPNFADHYCALWKCCGRLADHSGPLCCMAEMLQKRCRPLQNIAVHCGNAAEALRTVATFAVHCGNVVEALWTNADHCGALQKWCRSIADHCGTLQKCRGSVANYRDHCSALWKCFGSHYSALRLQQHLTRKHYEPSGTTAVHCGNVLEALRTITHHYGALQLQQHLTPNNELADYRRVVHSYIATTYTPINNKHHSN